MHCRTVLYCGFIGCDVESWNMMSDEHWHFNCRSIWQLQFELFDNCRSLSWQLNVGYLTVAAVESLDDNSNPDYLTIAFVGELVDNWCVGNLAVAIVDSLVDNCYAGYLTITTVVS